MVLSDHVADLCKADIEYVDAARRDSAGVALVPLTALAP